ncbi:YraN family protein [Pseudonocardia acidicola]|uniref:YraN family protein n=1 Tax=Pseudonocardia acidicola TaxID=2724939 RepID=A0ABX1SDI1_9PSEU|nr:YraN family protein [Pseudonocardia acidicola]
MARWIRSSWARVLSWSRARGQVLAHLPGPSCRILCGSATGLDKLVVCEVKTRSGTGFGEPAEAVTGRKAARIRRVTHAWLAAHRVRWCEIRFDVVAVLLEPGRPATLQHYEAAF